MNCCGQCDGIEQVFGEDTARRNLKDFLKNGPPKQTRVLLDEIEKRGVDGLSLLDIGGGIGAIQHLLVEAGVSKVIDVDASSAYLKTARAEAERRGYVERAEHRHGNFTDLAPEIAAVDIVTLDRVICCYHDMESLVRLSAEKAKKLYGFIYPIDTWWMRLAGKIANLVMSIGTNPFRAFIHPQDKVEHILETGGLHKVFHRNMGLWQVVLYAR